MFNNQLFFLIFFISVSISYLLTPLMRTIALKKGILSKPGRRMVHSRPIPYLGGLAIYFSFFTALLLVFYTEEHFRADLLGRMPALALGGTLIMILGLLDDIKDIKPIFKLLGQIIAALVLFYFGFRIDILTNLFSGQETGLPLLLSMVFTVLWTIGLINALNLIDGLDGLAAGITVIVCGSLFFIAAFLNNYLAMLLYAILAGSILGFLRYNFHPAKIFMGDAGSMFLGFMLAAISLIRSQYKSATAVVLLIPLTTLAIPVYDTLVTVLRRILRRAPVFGADKKHLHHRLLTTGLRQETIVWFMYLLTLYLGIFAFLFVLIPEKYALILLVLLGLGFFMGSRAIGFIERKSRLIHREELKKRRDEL